MILVLAIQDALSHCELPVKASDVTKLVKPLVGRAATPKAVTAVLESLAAAGTLNRISAGTLSKPQPLFTPHSLDAVAVALLTLAVQAAKKEQPAPKLKIKLPLGLQSHFEAALSQLVAQGAAYVQPGSKRLVHAHRPRPSELLSPVQRRTLQKTLDAVNSVRTRPATLDELIAWLDEESPRPPTSPPKSIATPGEAELRAWYDLDRVRSSTMMIPIPQTFARYQAWAAECGGVADSQVLRNLLEILYNNGHLLLEPCERPQDLPDHERALLVPMSLGPPGYSWCWIS